MKFNNGLFNSTALLMSQKSQTVLILKLFPSTSFASVKTISAFVDKDLQLMIKIVAQSISRIKFCYYWPKFSCQVCKSLINLKN